MSSKTASVVLTDDLVRLLTPKEAATLLGISVRKLWSLTNSREIPCVRIGTAVRIDQGDLRRYIEGRKTTLRKN